MHILIIGNGFDIAHGLPTRYSDFITNVQNNSEFSKYVLRNENSQTLFNRVRQSKIFEYMCSKLSDNNDWIDFENELLEIVDSICDMPSLFKRYTYVENKSVISKLLLDSDKIHESSPFIYRILMGIGVLKRYWSNWELLDLEKNIHRQIQDFIDLFKEYILWITQYKLDTVSGIKMFQDMKIDYLLSFNYTTTFLKLYNDHQKLIPENVCYVHGKIDEQTNTGIVMGIGSDFYDEVKHEKYVDFFKFFQCYKHSTSNDYLNWIRKYESWDFDDPGTMAHNLTDCTVSIYGHSLDPTDRNILKPFFDMDRITINIYYLNKDSKRKLERNILKILGKDLFTKYMTGTKSKIQFKHISSLDKGVHASAAVF